MGGPEIAVAHGDQKVDGPWFARPNSFRRLRSLGLEGLVSVSLSRPKDGWSRCREAGSQSGRQNVRSRGQNVGLRVSVGLKGPVSFAVADGTAGHAGVLCVRTSITRPVDDSP